MLKIILDTDLTPLTKINSKWITDLNVKFKTIKLLEYNIGENLHDPAYNDDILDTTPKSWSIKELTDKLDFIKIKNFCSAKDFSMRRQATGWENIFEKDTYDKGLYPKLQRLLKLNSKKAKTQLKNEPKTLTNNSSKKIYRWQISTPYIIRGI